MTVTINVSEPSRTWALYGATGVTGRLVLERAMAVGLRPRLVGRDPGRLHALAGPHGLEVAAAALENPVALDAALGGCAALVNVAGPFVRTAAPLAEACLRTGVDYLDLSGELASLRWLLAMDAAAAGAGVVLVGGAGFGIAATDSLARRVSEALGGAERLRISVAADSGLRSAAVAESTLEVLSGGGHEVAAGRLVQRRLARLRWQETAPNGEVSAFASAPLADLVGALHAASASEVVAGVPMPTAQACVIAAIAPLLPLLLHIPAARRQLANTGGHAASSAPHSTRRSRAWVSGWRGDRALGLMMEAGEGFAAAADMAIHALHAHLARRPAPGTYTPATAYGARWLDDLPGVWVSETHPSEERHPARHRHRQQPPPDLRRLVGRLSGRLLGHDVRKQKTTL